MKKNHLIKCLLFFAIFQLSFQVNLAKASDVTKDNPDISSSAIAGHNFDEVEYFSPNEIFINALIDVRQNDPLKFDENEICDRVVNIFKSATKNKIKVVCSKQYPPSVTNAKNLYIELQVTQVADVYSHPGKRLDVFSVVLISESEGFGSSKRKSLREGFNYRFFPYYGPETQKVLDKIIDETAQNFANQLIVE